jgi:CheY-like chemotaxis protein
VDLVQSRIERGEKQFDLIFMDMHMPVMDGLEAASIIAGLKTGTPIVAMTANIMPNDKELYKKSGLPDYLGKPFASYELWRCLLKYLKPVGRDAIDKSRQLDADTQLHRQLQISFAKSNRTKFEEIIEAIGGGDIKLAHTLKSNAGQIRKTGLQKAAAAIEEMLIDGENSTTEEALSLFEAELSAVLKELAPMLDEVMVSSQAPFNREQALALLEDLEPMLRTRNPECQNLLDRIRAVPGAEELADMVEDFDFKRAISTLSELRKEWV